MKFLVSDPTYRVSFFCGGSRNFNHFIDLFDGVFVLHVADWHILNRRLAQRPNGIWGGGVKERLWTAHRHHTQEGLPEQAIIVDATQELSAVVQSILKAAKIL